ncbi:MAG: hypothetical protein ACYC9S_11645 [Leptospirales bacterium]
MGLFKRGKVWWMTQRYAHFSPDNLREAIRVLDTIITISAQSGGDGRGEVS